MIRKSNAIIIIGILAFITMLSGCVSQGVPLTNVNDNVTAGTLNVYCNLAWAFEKLNPGVSINVINGTNNASVASMISGQSVSGQMSVSCISLPPSDVEYVDAKNKGVNLQMTEIGIDSISVFVNPSNNLTDLNVSQLDDIFCSGLVNNWSQLGSGSNSTIDVYVPSDPDVVEQFTGAVDNKNLPVIGSAQSNTSRMVLNDSNGIGYGLKSQLDNNVKVVDVNGLSSQWGDYPLSYQLYLVTNGTPSGVSLDFLNYVLSHSGQEVVHSSGLTALDPTV
jgi:phosphate transport system substrate-binding protein